jgi:hypothetical protein
MSPHPGTWNESIAIRLPDADRVEVVGNARQAKEILLQRWPPAAATGPAYTSALTACDEVLSGHAPAYLSRIAFFKAAREARLASDK